MEVLRSAWEARRGGVAIAAGPGVELQKAPLVSAQEKALQDTGRYVRALVTYGKGDPVVHVVSLYGHAGAGDIPEKMRKKRAAVEGHLPVPGGAWCRAHHDSGRPQRCTASLWAVRSAVDVGGWADCAALDAEATARSPPATCHVHTGAGNRIDVVLANRISKHALL